MDALDREFGLLAASVERTARVQQREVRRFLDGLKPRRVPTSAETPTVGVAAADQAEPDQSHGRERHVRRGAGLARHLSDAYDGVLAHIAQRRTDYNSLPDRIAKAGAVTEMRQLVAGARSLHRSLGWLDAASSPPLDLGTRYLVDHLAARLVAPEAEVTVVAGERSYGKVTNPLSSVFALSGAKPSQEDLAIVIFLPRRERRSGLLHPLLIHELGHAADDQHRLVSQVLQRTSEASALMADMAAAAEEHVRATGDDLAATVQSFGARLIAWVEEAVCDAFAVQLLGPTYLYAFMAIVGTSDLDSAGEEHPPTRQRIRLVLEQLDQLGWSELMAEASAEIDDWFRKTAAHSPEPSDSEERFCVEAIHRLAPQIRATIAAHVGDLSFEAGKFDPVAQEIADLLGAGIPPSQTIDRDLIERPGIILGCWLFGVHRAGGNLPALAVAADVPELSRLLPKALEDGALLHGWDLNL